MKIQTLLCIVLCTLCLWNSSQAADLDNLILTHQPQEKLLNKIITTNLANQNITNQEFWKTLRDCPHLTYCVVSGHAFCVNFIPGQHAHLRKLNVSNGNLTKLSLKTWLSQLPQLEHLTASKNNITTLGKNKDGECWPCETKKTKNHPLQYLDVSHNKIKTFRFGQLNDMPNLATLDLSNNPLEHISIETLTSRQQSVNLRLKNTQLSVRNHNELYNGACIRRARAVWGVGIGIAAGTVPAFWSSTIIMQLHQILYESDTMQWLSPYTPFIVILGIPIVATIGSGIGYGISRCIPVTQSMIDKLYTLDFGDTVLESVHTESEHTETPLFEERDVTLE
jgi:hypothetical protein